MKTKVSFPSAGLALAAIALLSCRGETPDANAAAAQAAPLDSGVPVWVAVGSMATARERRAAALLPSGKVLVAGGIDDEGSPTATAELYDPAAGTAATRGTAGKSATARTRWVASSRPERRACIASSS